MDSNWDIVIFENFFFIAIFGNTVATNPLQQEWAWFFHKQEFGEAKSW